MKNFNISITKEQLAALPIAGIDRPISVVDTVDDAVAALEALGAEEVVGFDTETKPTFKKGRTNTVSLIQVSTHDHAYLFRLNKIGFIDELKNFLENPGMAKVGLSLKDDFFVLHKVRPFSPAGFIDIQSLAKEYSISDSSLQKIYGIIFGRRISKHQRLSNWEAESLTPAQQAYAALDAKACLDIYDYLNEGHFIPSESQYLKPVEEDEQPLP